MKKAVITGITGQDGSYLAVFLLEKGYDVHGLIRRSSISNTGRIDHLIREDKIVLHGGDMTDSTSLVRIIGEVRPDEIYNLGAQSHVQVSFEAPEYAGDVDALGVLRILEAVRMVGLAEERLSLPVRSHWQPEESPAVSRIISIWAIWIPRETGAMRRTMWNACG